MWGPTSIRYLRDVFHGRAYQSLAILFCVLYGLALIANNQLAGEATWFWYAKLFHSGSKLYADLHLALQPLFVLEMDGWMQLFGIKCLVTEIPSVIHLLFFCLGLFLLLRESDWGDWQKAIVIVGSFVFWTAGPSYRFDDYHVTTESFILYSLLLVLLIAKTDAAPRQLKLALALGVLGGLTTTSRLNDGAALFGATSISLLVLARKRRFLVTGLFAAVSVLTALAVVKCTGDSFTVYVASTLTRAVGSKGGAGSILAHPYQLFLNAVYLRHGYKWLFRAVIVLAVAGALIQRYWKKSVLLVVVGQMVIVPAAFAFSSHMDQQKLFDREFFDFAISSTIVITYLLSVVVLVRFAMWILSSGKWQWDKREILILFPFFEMASNAATAGAEPHSGYYAQMVLLLLLLPLLQPRGRQIAWANATFLTILLSLAVIGTVLKAGTPYYWDSMRARPMFVDRQWYRHPVYGPMYIQTDLLQLNTKVCADTGGIGSHAELLSLPLPYPNYFCDTPPWHGYVQTFFDITPKSTMERLMAELQTAPPQWIVYQRQLGSMWVLEQLFNHGRSMPQRDLDRLIVQKVTTGQWKVVDSLQVKSDNGWYVIRTRP